MAGKPPARPRSFTVAGSLLKSPIVDCLPAACRDASGRGRHSNSGRSPRRIRRVWVLSRRGLESSSAFPTDARYTPPVRPADSPCVRSVRLSRRAAIRWERPEPTSVGPTTCFVSSTFSKALSFAGNPHRKDNILRCHGGCAPARTHGGNPLAPMPPGNGHVLHSSVGRSTSLSDCLLSASRCNSIQPIYPTAFPPVLSASLMMARRAVRGGSSPKAAR